MTYEVEITPDTDVLEATADAYGRAPGTMRTQVERFLVPRARKLLLTKLQTYPPPRAGSRYRRTGRLKRGWKVLIVITEYSGSIGASNQVSYTEFVMGARQQWYHAETGWQKADNLVADSATQVQDQLITIWEEVSAVQDEFGVAGRGGR